MNVFRRISRAISRLSHSSAPVPAEGAMAAQVDLGQVEAAERQELEPEEPQEPESE
ncbi:MAG: hypothetical protein ACJ75L_07540 [Gaiellaceae bacterium]